MRRPRLHTILLLVSLAVLLLPVVGIGYLRLYQSALVRQTESELIGQGAFVAAAYKAALLRAAQKRAGFSLDRYGLPLPPTAPRPPPGERWVPRWATLDFAHDRILPSPLPATSAPVADALAVSAGREITALMREAQSTTLAAIRVVDFEGTVVASTGEEVGLSLAQREEIRGALAGEHVSLMRARLIDSPDAPDVTRETGVRVFVAVPIVERGRVLGAALLARTPATLKHTLYRKRVPIVAGFLIVIAAAALVAWLTAVTIVRPLKAVIRQTERAVRGEKGAVTPLARPGTREVAQLSAAVAQLARTLEARADYIRDFAAHVSHEFKTPLTAIQGAVELLREHGASMTEDERDRFLGNLAADSQRLERLVRRLLELARADTLQPDTGACVPGSVLERAVQAYRTKGVRIFYNDRSGNVTVALGEETLESIVGNLIDNACQHGGADVTVAVQAERVDTDVRILVSDDGPGISAANAERIFRPFFTTAREHGGTGLGLAVVRSLLAAHHGRIELLPADKGAVFEVWLPVHRTSERSSS